MVQRYEWGEDGMHCQDAPIVGVPQYVPAEDFAAVEAERDELKRQNEEIRLIMDDPTMTEHQTYYAIARALARHAEAKGGER